MPEHISNIFVSDSSVVKLTSISDFSIFVIITARKRSLGQGNIFTSVCQEFCSQGDGVPGLGERGAWCQGGACSWMAWSRGVPGPRRGFLVLGGAWWRLPPPRTATAAGGTHPTGMHSCLRSDLKVL